MIDHVDCWRFEGGTTDDDLPLPKVGEVFVLGDGRRKEWDYSRGGSERAMDALYWTGRGVMLARVRLFNAVPTVHMAMPNLAYYNATSYTVMAGYVSARDAIIPLMQRWMHRGVATHAASAMREVGLFDWADKLAAIKPWSFGDNDAASAAAQLAWEASDAAEAARDAGYGRLSYYDKRRFDRAANLVLWSADAIEDGATDPMWKPSLGAWECADDVADSAGDAADAERELQNTELDAALRALLGIAQ